MSGNHQMEAHYMNSGYSYPSTDNYVNFFGDTTHAPVNYIYSGQLNNQENVYWAMNMNPYRYGYSDPGSNSYYGYGVNTHLPSSEVNQRAWEYPTLPHVEEPSNAEQPLNAEEPSNVEMSYEDNADSSSEDSSEERLSNHDASNSEAEEDWPDNIDPDNMTYEALARKNRLLNCINFENSFWQGVPIVIHIFKYLWTFNIITLTIKIL